MSSRLERRGARASRVTRRTFVAGVAAGGLTALWASCAPSTPGSGPPPVSAPSGAVPSGAGPGAPQSTAAWDALVAAAKQEGKVVVKGPPDPEVRVDLPRAFRERFGIELEYLAGPTGPFATQLVNERQAGVYTTDVVLAGADSMYTVFYKERMLEPLPPVLIHPQAADQSAWPEGKYWFMDPEQQYILRINNSVQIMGQINTNYVKPEQFTNWHDLLRSEYTGKIAAFDPTVSGSGIGTATYLYVMVGEDYVRRLYLDQKVALSRDDRQLADWVARGAYPVVLGGEFVAPAARAEFQRGGINVINLPRPVDAPGGVSPSFGLLGLLSNAPHPNAARVFVNWIAAPEGMTVWSKAQTIVPIRLDIDKSAWPADLVPDPNVKNYHDSYGWDFVHNDRQTVMPKLREMLR